MCDICVIMIDAYYNSNSNNNVYFNRFLHACMLLTVNISLSMYTMIIIAVVVAVLSMQILLVGSFIASSSYSNHSIDNSANT